MKLVPKKQLTDTEAALIASWLNNKKHNQYSENRHYKHTVEMQKAYVRGLWESGTAEYYLVRGDNYDLKGVSDWVGSSTVTLDPINLSANIGVLIDPLMTEVGYATDVFTKLMQRLTRRGYRKFEAGMMASNIAMQKVCLNVGMQFEAVVKDHFLLNGEREDMVLFGKTV